MIKIQEPSVVEYEYFLESSNIHKLLMSEIVDDIHVSDF